MSTALAMTQWMHKKIKNSYFMLNHEGLKKKRINDLIKLMSNVSFILL